LEVDKCFAILASLTNPSLTQFIENVTMADALSTEIAHIHVAFGGTDDPASCRQSPKARVQAKLTGSGEVAAHTSLYVFEPNKSKK
jgi:hypothetical protein